MPEVAFRERLPRRLLSAMPIPLNCRIPRHSRDPIPATWVNAAFETFSNCIIKRDKGDPVAHIRDGRFDQAIDVLLIEDQTVFVGRNDSCDINLVIASLWMDSDPVLGWPG